MTKTVVSVVLPVLAPTPFLRDMTKFAIKTLWLHAEQAFELVVVEAGEPFFSYLPEKYPEKLVKYLNFNPKIGGVRELNAGVDAASGDFVLCTGNDVFVPPNWDRELLRCFEERDDCGLASLSAFERGATIGPERPLDMLVEGWYSPFIMFRKGRRFDEAYRKIYQDSDFIMQTYELGLRPFRSCRAHVHHLLRMTSDRVEPERHLAELARDEALFYQRWGNSPLAAFAVIRGGGYAFGREHESFLRPVAGGNPNHPANRRLFDG